MQLFSRRFVPIAMIVCGVATPAAAAAPAMDPSLGQVIADASTNACYGVASGAIPLPIDHSPNALDLTIRAVEKMGLTFGVDDRMLKELGTLGQTLVSRATIGSRALDGGDIVVTFGGPQPGCRVLFLATDPSNVTDAVATRLSSSGWKAVPAMTAQRGSSERRAFLRRDDQGAPYLMNVWTIGDPASMLRLITTTVRIPSGVTLPAGF